MLNLHHSCVLAGAALAIALQACTVRDTQVQPPPAAPATAPETFRRIEIDTRKPLGTLRSLQGVNGAPAPGFHKPEDFLFGEWNIPESWDATPGYREARIDLVRTHDAYGPGDIDPIFGPEPGATSGMIAANRTPLAIFPDPDADPADPRSYNFGPTDALIASIHGIGAQVLFRIGRSEGSRVTPPKDPHKYAQIARHIVLHYNQGWANGFRYGIRYWEIWNEPDLGRLFWGGTPQQFHELYGAIAKAVKEADPKAMVGGPAISRPNDVGPYREGFLEHVRRHALPFDFYSWHWYATDSNDPQDFVRIARDVRKRLDSYGFTKTLSVLDEWNYGLMEPWPVDMQRAAFVATSAMYLQDAPVDISALYRADNLFGADGKRANKTGQALIALGRLRDTPVRLTARGADEDGFAVLAGRSTDGRTLQVLVSNYEVPPPFRGKRGTPDVLSAGDAFSVNLLARRDLHYRNNAGYDLAVNGLPASGEVEVERFRITANDDFVSLGRTRQRAGALRLHGALPAPGIELIRISIVR